MAFSKNQKLLLVLLIIINSAALVLMFIPTEAPAETRNETSSRNEEKQTSKPSQSDGSIVIDYEPVAELSEEERQELWDSWRIDVNTADVDALSTLHRVGPSLAQRIIDYRQEHGPFVTENDLTKVRGIGPAMLGGIRDFITFGDIDPALIQERKEEAAEAEKPTIINLNTASQSELTSLPRIGPATATNIINYREEIGGFKNIEQIMEVSRIGPAIFESIKDMITVE